MIEIKMQSMRFDDTIVTKEQVLELQTQYSNSTDSNEKMFAAIADETAWFEEAFIQTACAEDYADWISWSSSDYAMQKNM
jgi:hypothetical protein